MTPHPCIPKTIKWGSKAAVWIGGSVLLSSALGVLGVLCELWGPKDLADWAVFCASGPMFAAYVTGCLIAGGVNRRGVLVPMFWYGVLFPVWGFVLGFLLAFVGGTGGVPQAVITAIVFRKATKSWIPGIGAIVGLGVALGTLVVNDRCRILPLGWMALLTFPWHATVVTALVVWVVRIHRKQELQMRPERGLCPKCGYDRAGIAADAKCPECGAIPKGA